MITIMIKTIMNRIIWGTVKSLCPIITTQRKSNSSLATQKISLSAHLTDLCKYLGEMNGHAFPWLNWNQSFSLQSRLQSLGELLASV